MTTIGISRKQRVFAIIESTVGTLVFPTAGAGFIRPAGNAVMNQNPEFTDSLELVNSLDVLNQFQSATPPGTWNVPQYIRPGGLATAPQADVIWKSFMGDKKIGTTASLTATLSSSGLSMTIDTISDTNGFPTKGVIRLGTEDIYYGASTQTASAATATLTSLSRAYASTATTNYAVNDNVTMRSCFYKQSTVAPSFSLWIETDHFVQGMSGCATQQGVLGVTNEGGVLMGFSGAGMQMVWAGKDQLAASTASGGSSVTVNDASNYSAGAFVQNITQGHTKASAGYEISSVNTTTNVLVLGTTLEGAWATDDYLTGFLPGGTVVGDTMENKDTSVLIADVAATFKGTDLTFDTPKQYITDEVGTTYPQAYMEDVRSITSTLGLYFRNTDAKYFSDGYAGNDVTLQITFGDTEGSQMEIYFPKVKLQVPNINLAPPAVEINMEMKALGTSGEDSCEIVFI